MQSTSIQSANEAFLRIEEAFERAENVFSAIQNYVPNYQAEDSIHLNIGSGAFPGVEMLSAMSNGGVWCSIEPFRGIYDSKELNRLERLMYRWLKRRGLNVRHIDIIINQCVEETCLNPNTVNYGKLNFCDVTYPPIFDLVFSVAVLEHVWDLETFISNNFKCLKPGGICIHWVDFRDHRDFSRPLEFLTISKDDWDKTYSPLNQYPSGSGVRPSHLDRLFSRCGFDLMERLSTCVIDSHYLREVRLRLHPDFQYYSVDDISTGGIMYVLQRPP